MSSSPQRNILEVANAARASRRQQHDRQLGSPVEETVSHSFAPTSSSCSSSISISTNDHNAQLGNVVTSPLHFFIGSDHASHPFIDNAHRINFPPFEAVFAKSKPVNRTSSQIPEGRTVPAVIENKKQHQPNHKEDGEEREDDEKRTGNTHQASTTTITTTTTATKPHYIPLDFELQAHLRNIDFPLPTDPSDVLYDDRIPLGRMYAKRDYDSQQQQQAAAAEQQQQGDGPEDKSLTLSFGPASSPLTAVALEAIERRAQEELDEYWNARTTSSSAAAAAVVVVSAPVVAGTTSSFSSVEESTPASFSTFTTNNSIKTSTLTSQSPIRAFIRDRAGNSIAHASSESYNNNMKENEKEEEEKEEAAIERGSTYFSASPIRRRHAKQTMRNKNHAVIGTAKHRDSPPSLVEATASICLDDATSDLHALGNADVAAGRLRGGDDDDSDTRSTDGTNIESDYDNDGEDNSKTEPALLSTPYSHKRKGAYSKKREALEREAADEQEEEEEEEAYYDIGAAWTASPPAPSSPFSNLPQWFSPASSSLSSSSSSSVGQIAHVVSSTARSTTSSSGATVLSEEQEEEQEKGGATTINQLTRPSTGEVHAAANSAMKFSSNNQQLVSSQNGDRRVGARGGGEAMYIPKLFFGSSFSSSTNESVARDLSLDLSSAAAQNKSKMQKNEEVEKEPHKQERDIVIVAHHDPYDSTSAADISALPDLSILATPPHLSMPPQAATRTTFAVLASSTSISTATQMQRNQYTMTSNLVLACESKATQTSPFESGIVGEKEKVDEGIFTTNTTTTTATTPVLDQREKAPLSSNKFIPRQLQHPDSPLQIEHLTTMKVPNEKFVEGTNPKGAATTPLNNNNTSTPVKDSNSHSSNSASTSRRKHDFEYADPVVSSIKNIDARLEYTRLLKYGTLPSSPYGDAEVNKFVSAAASVVTPVYTRGYPSSSSSSSSFSSDPRPIYAFAYGSRSSSIYDKVKVILSPLHMKQYAQVAAELELARGKH